MPVFQGSKTLREAVRSIVSQSYQQFELIIVDDNFHHAKDELLQTQHIIRSFRDKRFRIFNNSFHLGSAKTIQKLAHLAKNDILFFLCQDDILAPGTLQKVHDVFTRNPQVGVLTRPFFWFDENIKRPIRAVTPYNPDQNTILTLFDGKKAIEKIFESVGQISGLAYRKKFLTVDFHSNTFAGHIYPFAAILLHHQCMFLKDYTVAVRLRTSQTRHISSIYKSSPTLSWVTMFRNVYSRKEYKEFQKIGIDQIVKHYEGLVQLKNYANFRILINEIIILARSRWQNIFSPRFWLYMCITILTPAFLLRKMTDVYKRYVLSRKVNSIYFPQS